MPSADAHVGERLRQKRVALGLSQSVVAKGLSLTFQQVQKYEKGANSLNVQRLVELSRLLRVPVSYFFDGLEGSAAPRAPAEVCAMIAPGERASEREILEIVKSFTIIRDKSLRRRLADLMR